MRKQNVCVNIKTKDGKIQMVQVLGHFKKRVDCAYMSGAIQSFMHSLSKTAWAKSKIESGNQIVYFATERDRQHAQNWLTWLKKLCEQDEIVINYL